MYTSFLCKGQGPEIAGANQLLSSNPAGFYSNFLGFRAELQIALVCATQNKNTPNHRVKQFTTNGQQLTVPNRQMYVYIYKCKFHKHVVPPKTSIYRWILHEIIHPAFGGTPIYGNLHTYPSIYLSVDLSIYLSIYISIYLSIYLSIYIYIYSYIYCNI